MTRSYHVLFGAAAVLLAAGCGSLRQTWVCKDVEVGVRPRTQQKYAIRSMVVSFGENHRGDAVTTDLEKCASPNTMNASREWVDCLYDMFPAVFDRAGTPIDLTAEWILLEEDVPGFERSGTRSFFGKIGFLTLIPLIPVETVAMFRWQIKVAVDGESSETFVDTVSEELGACSPLGFFCFYDSDEKGNVQFVSGLTKRYGMDNLRKQMEALGLATSATLARMESDGQVRIGQENSTVTDSARRVESDDFVHRLLDSKRKELEDLKKAGIIDEAEFAAEMKKLEGAGK